MVSMFVLLWLLVTNSVLAVSLLTLYWSQCLAKWVTNLVRFGKLVDRSSDVVRTPTDQTIDTFVAKWAEVPKQYFTHFYIFSLTYHLVIIVIMFATNCFNTYGYNDGNNQCYEYMNQLIGLIIGRNVDTNWRRLTSQSNILLMVALITQFSRRLYENVKISVFSDTKINVIHYAIGFVFYLSCGLALIDTIGGEHRHQSLQPIVWFAVFLMASYFQFKSHHILSELRLKTTKEGQRVVDYNHFIPMGTPFTLISCPHYLSEIVIYLCICGISQYNHLWLTLLYWVCISQTMASLLTHEWYSKTFGHKYPKHRKAIIPYIL